MGFSGSFVVCHSVAEFDEVAPVADRDEGVAWEAPLQDNWRVGQYLGEFLFDEVDDLLTELVLATGMPAILGYVLDSSQVFVTGISAASGLWRLRLGPASTTEESDDESQRLERAFASPPEISASNAATWAADAGRTHDPSLLVSVIDPSQDPAGNDDYLPAEGRFFQLLTALGVTAPDTDPS